MFALIGAVAAMALLPGLFLVTALTGDSALTGLAETTSGGGDMGSLDAGVPAGQVEFVEEAAKRCEADPAAIAASIITFLGPDTTESWPVKEAAAQLEVTGTWDAYRGEKVTAAKATNQQRIETIGAIWCAVAEKFGDWPDVTEGETYTAVHLGVWSATGLASTGVKVVMDAGHTAKWSKEWQTAGVAYAQSALSMGLVVPGYGAKIDPALERTGPGVARDGTYRLTKGGSGRLDRSELCPVLGSSVWVLRCDAAAALDAWNVAFKAKFRRSMAGSCGAPCAYRSYEEQVATKRANGNMAAEPGYSNHGWGLAFDFHSATYGGSSTAAEYLWMRANARAFGWDHPSWARVGGSKQELWHWEYIGAS
ncbi:M15 family metallopeptidase [Rarobacter faecitabidus]|uniref:M15 family metallopeptidase n=1 Tax=Rarobacter faecitabidus TaxID=13243 RepID=UPI001476DEC7|nr:M15 family metallopeptidase [Rarobacter faecitabidus]